VIGGISLSAFSEQPVKDFDWQKELVAITRPILSSLNELTEKPRRIDELRSQIERYEDQLEVIDKALDSIDTFRQQTPPDIIADKFEVVAAAWRQRKVDTDNALEVARYQLASLQGEDISMLEAVKAGTYEFLLGRGLTLGIALGVAVLVWFVMRALLWLFRKRPSRETSKQKITRNRLVLYSYRGLTALFMLLAVMTVFYIRGDLLLLALSILGLAIFVLALRQTLPRYIAETQLLLDVGPVRTGERLIHNGLPMQVKSINMHSVLSNPELEGMIRLPLGALSAMASRPCNEESWFPTRVGEYVLLTDHRYGQVLRQTLETVQLKIAGSLVQFPTVDFLQLSLRNLSREGFGLAVTFGIDYQHQSICLDQAPPRFHEALRRTFAREALADEVNDILVEFKEAGVNSLDYLIYLTMKGSAAGSYYKIGRLIQQTCVEVCNREGWGIPFAQLTIHQAES
jgi:small-conductance mechanosensitive channel